VVDGFIHKLGATYDGHKVRVWSSTLGKPEIDLEKMDSKPSTTGYFEVIKHRQNKEQHVGTQG